ncbi:MAG TPA: YfhO family protein [Thermoanaerobaculia bacterium]|nr:YfhO family protein [Thermoanaerobaculia bacterium]
MSLVISSAAVFNPTWLVAGVVYGAAVWLARRRGVDLPRRVAVFFYLLVFVFFYPILTQDAVNTSVDYLGTLPPWEYTVEEHHAGNPQLNDLALQIVPWAHQVREGWRALEPPLWNHSSAAGYPLLASAQSSALSPLRLLGLPLSLAHAMSFEAAMKVLIALTFMYLWCRRRYSEMASVCGAVAFGFSTFVIVWLHFPLITTACFVPAVFLALDLLAERITYGRFVFLAAIGTAMLFGGHPETVSHTAFLAALYVLWLLLAERVSPRILMAIGGAAVVTLLLAAPFLAPFAEAVTKSKRYQELEGRVETGEVPHTDATAKALLVSPRFPPAGHAEAVSGFAGILGIAAWIAVAAHAIVTRKWRSRETFFVLAALLCLGVILDWPLIGDAFHLLFSLAANARVRLLLVLLLAALTAAAIDLVDRRRWLFGLTGAGALMLLTYITMRHELGAIVMLPSVAVLIVAAFRQSPLPGHGERARVRGEASSDGRPLTPTLSPPARGEGASMLLLLTAITAELWSNTRGWNPVVPDRWMYPKTPMLHALDDAAKTQKTPFRIVGNAATFFPNVSAVYGYEDVRAHDPMTPGRYVGLLAHVVGYDPAEYFARWPEWEHPILDYLNVRYVLTSAGGELPHGFRKIYDGSDGTLFENEEVLPRFFAVPNVVIEFRDAVFAQRLRDLSWKDTALLEELQVEHPRMHDDFFRPRPPGAPAAKADLVRATPTDYRLHVTAPRWSLVASSVPWWPGWKVERNGLRVEPIRVNGAFLGFAVPPGEVDVRVWYDPWTFRLGAIISAATLAALVAYGVRRR